MSEQKKNKEPPKRDMSTVSIRQLPKLDVKEDVKGENLTTFSENEWDASEEPFSAELLNVKNAPNRISVFSGPKRADEIEVIKKKSKTGETRKIFDERAFNMAKMMENVFEKMVDGRSLENIKVTINFSVE